jgi:hypothetical protein
MGWWHTKAARFTAMVVVGIGIFVTPWWCACLLLTLYVLFYRAFVEAVVGGVLLDGLYTLPSAWGDTQGYIFTSAFLILSVLWWWIRKRLWTSAHTLTS